MISIDRFERGEIGTAFVDGHRLGHAILGDRFFKVTPGCSLVTMGAQHEIDGVAVFVNGAAEYMFDLFMVPSYQELESPPNSGQLNPLQRQMGPMLRVSLRAPIIVPYCYRIRDP